MIWMITKTDNAPILAQDQLSQHQLIQGLKWKENVTSGLEKSSGKKKKRLTDAELQEITN